MDDAKFFPTQEEKENNNPLYYMKMYKERNKQLIKANDDKQSEIYLLRKERDEARRIACEMEERAGCDESGYPKNGEAEEIATRRGWDCFKEAP